LNTGVAVSNTTCLIALERIGRLDLLHCSFSQVFIPNQVQEEFGSERQWLHVREVSNVNVLQALKLQMDDGEAAAVALSLQLAPQALILDDRKARRIASQLGLPLIGTVGLLLRAKRLGVISEVKTFFEQLRSANFHLSRPLYLHAIHLAQEDEDQ